MSRASENAEAPISWTTYVLVGVAIAIVSLLWWRGLLARGDDFVWDRLFAADIAAVDSPFTIVEIDARSLKAVGTWPWPRSVYGDLLEQASNLGARAIFLDVDLSARSDARWDQALATAMQGVSDTTPVFLPVFIQNASSGGSELILQQPLAPFARHAQPVAVNMQPDPDGLVRRLAPALEWSGQRWDSVWSVLSGNRDVSTLIDYGIDPASFARISSIDLLRGAVDPDLIDGKVLWIGATAIELGDILAVPLHRALPGVVVGALGAQTLAQGGLYEMRILPASLLAWIWFAAAVALIARLRWTTALAATIFFAGAWVLLAATAYRHAGLLMPAAAPLLGLVLIYAIMTISRLDAALWETLLLRIRLRDRDTLLANLYARAGDGILHCDSRGTILYANPVALALARADSADSIKLTDLFPDAPGHLETWPGEATEQRLCDQQGEIRSVEASSSPVVLSDEATYTVVFRDISERVAHQETLRYAARHDRLTGLFNRSWLFERIAERLAGGAWGHFVLINLDNFHEVNETFGHHAGDRLLALIAQRFEKLAPGMLGRLGGDTFGVWLEDSREEAAAAATQRILGCFEAPFTVDGVDLEVWATAGVAAFERGSSSTDEAGTAHVERLMRHASSAVRRARGGGMDIAHFRAEMIPADPKRLEVVPLIRSALQEEQFRLFYQPKVTLADEATCSWEVLLRWPEAHTHRIPIPTLIEVAENARLIAPITLWSTEQVLALHRDWHNAQLPQNFALNLSARLLHNRDFIRRLRSLLEARSADVHIEMEITETAFMTNREGAVAALRDLQAAGVTIAIDDFGTGYSSLAYLRDLRANILKIDRSFITDLPEDEGKQVIVRSTIHMAHDLGMQVVAEGVETAAERDWLRDVDCDIAQGYFYGRPMPEEDLLAWHDRFESKRLKRTG